VTSNLQKREDLRPYIVVKKLASPNSGLKRVNLNACSGQTVRFLVGEHRGFLKKGVKTYLMAPMAPFNTPTIFFIVTSIVYKVRGPRRSSGVMNNYK
jgi:hypothetical protein